MKKIIALCMIFIIMAISLPASFAFAEESDSGGEQKIYYAKDFDEKVLDPFDNMTLSRSDSTIELAEEENGNSYMHFEKSDDETSKMYFEIKIPENTEEKMIFQFDVFALETGTKVGFNFTDSSDTSYAPITIDGEKICDKSELKQDAWVTIVAVFDYGKETITVKKADGTEIAAFPMKDNYLLKDFLKVRASTYNSSGVGTIYFDNIYIYSGDKILTTEELGTCHYATTWEYGEVKENTEALTIYGDYLIGGKKGKDESLVLVKGDDFFVSQEKLAALLGKTVSGSGYVPYDEFFENIGKTAVYDEKGLLYWSSGGDEASMTESESWTMYSYLAYVSPDAEYLKTNIKISHPRISIEDGRIEEIKKEIVENSYAKQYYKGSESFIRQYLNDGSVVNYPESGSIRSTARELNRRIVNFAMHYLITEDQEDKQKYKDRIWQELEVVCGDGLPDWRPASCLDNGEMARAVAHAYDWLYDDWTEEQRKTIREALYEKALKYAKLAYGYQMSNSITWWVDNKSTNQNAVANGGYILAALALMDDYPEDASWVLEKAIRSMEYYQNSFYPGGSWEESVTYWTYAMEGWTPAVRSMMISYGTDFGMSHAPDIEKSAEYVLHMSSQLCGANNYHDGGDNIPLYYIGDFYGMAKIFNRSDLANVKLTYDLTTFPDNPPRMSASVLLDFPAEAQVGKINLAKDAVFYKDGLVSFRESWDDPRSMFVSFHGGHGFPGGHAHIDTGTFVYDYLGERFAVDLGVEDYDLVDSAGAKKLYRIRPEGHNCLVINPDETPGQNMEAFSPVEEFSAKDTGSYAIINMSESYESYAESVRRGFKTADNRNSVIIRDEITSLASDSDIYWFMHTKAEVKISEDGKSAILTQNGKSIKFEVDTDAENYVLKVMDAVPLETSPQIKGQKDNSEYKKLALVIKADAGDSLYIQVKLSPISEDTPQAEDILLDSWGADELGKIYLESEDEDEAVIRGEVGRKNVFAAIAVYKNNELEKVALASNNSYDGMTVKCSLKERNGYVIKLIMWESATLLKPISEALLLKE